MHLKSFVRERILTFPVLILALINLMKKSLQVSLNDVLGLCSLPSITKQAFSKARKNLSPKVFILLNRKLLEEYYSDNECLTWKGFRLIAIDGSDIQLPQKEELISRFGCAKNDKGPALVMAKLSCAYDVLNFKTLDAQIDRCKSSERDLAIENIESIRLLNHDMTNDLYIFDRGYPSLGMMFYLIDKGENFLMRCSMISCFSSIKAKVHAGHVDFVHRFHANQTTQQQTAELVKRLPLLDKQKAYIDVRVVIVTLDTGEKELLISSLIDKEKYPAREFKGLYKQRWGKEENYKWYKVGMELENFSGHSALAVEQEIYALVFTANVTSLLMEEAQEELAEENKDKELKYEYRINKRIAVASLKDRLVTVLFSLNGDIEEFCANIKEKFKKNLCPIRLGRKFRRPKKGRRKYGCTLRRCL